MASKVIIEVVHSHLFLPHSTPVLAAACFSFLASENVSCHRSWNQIPKRGFEMEPGSLGCRITRLHVSYALDNDFWNVPRLSAINLCHARQCVLIITVSFCHIVGNSLDTSVHITVIFQLFSLSSGRILIQMSGQSPFGNRDNLGASVILA